MMDDPFLHTMACRRAASSQRPEALQLKIRSLVSTTSAYFQIFTRLQVFHLDFSKHFCGMGAQLLSV
jgi:hypothetical protein